MIFFYMFDIFGVKITLLNVTIGIVFAEKADLMLALKCMVN